MRSVAFFLGIFLLVACKPPMAPKHVSGAKVADVEKVSGHATYCANGDGSEQRPCNVSYMHLIADPESYHGRWVEFIAYSPGRGTRAIYFNEDQFEYRDFDASVFLEENYEKMPTKAGFIKLRGFFRSDSRRSEFAGGSYRKFGTLSQIKMALELRSNTERVEECARVGCVVHYVDGLVPLTIPKGVEAKID